MEETASGDRVPARLRASSLWHFAGWFAVLAVTGSVVGDRIDGAPMFYVQMFGLFAAIIALIGAALPRMHRQPRFGAANSVTLGRAAIACLLTGLLGNASGVAALGWLPAAAVLVALILDGLDGWLARRQGTSSAFGARFDLEIDALTIMILAVLVFEQGKAGAWVLLIGALRYAFLAAGAFRPRLAASLPASKRRQTICVLQYVALGLCLAPVLAPAAATALAGASLALLIGSFLIDIDWLVRQSAPHNHAREALE